MCNVNVKLANSDKLDYFIIVDVAFLPRDSCLEKDYNPMSENRVRYFFWVFFIPGKKV